jgi:hypothetical protein
MTRYAVDVEIDVTNRPVRTVTDSAQNLETLANSLPKDAQLRALLLPNGAGVISIGVDLDATGPADALHKLTLAVELLSADLNGLDTMAVLKNASVRAN